jgi:hypothetical protein
MTRQQHALSAVRLLIEKPPYLSYSICFSLWYLCHVPIDLHHRHRPEADVFHSISVPPGFLGPS